MDQVKSGNPALRVLMTAPGLLFGLTAISGLSAADGGGKVFCAVLLLISAAWCFQAARIGLVIDRHGITERSIGRPRRTPWQDVEDVAIRQGRAASEADYWLIELRLRDGRTLLVERTTSHSRPRVEEDGNRIAAMRTAALGGDTVSGLSVREADADEKYGKPLGAPVIGPDDVPVVVRLSGTGGVSLNWEAVVLPGGVLVGLLAAVGIAFGRLVSAVRGSRRKPVYHLRVEVGGPEPRTLALGFDTRAKAVARARDLVAAVGERGADAVPVAAAAAR